jgi:hypothetical protein
VVQRNCFISVVKQSRKRQTDVIVDLVVRDEKDEAYAYKLSGRQIPKQVNRPERSSLVASQALGTDTLPLFHWRHLISVVYVNRLSNTDELKGSEMTSDLNNINSVMFQRVLLSRLHRFRECIPAGTHKYQYLL